MSQGLSLGQCPDGPCSRCMLSKLSGRAMRGSVPPDSVRPSHVPGTVPRTVSGWAMLQVHALEAVWQSHARVRPSGLCPAEPCPRDCPLDMSSEACPLDGG